MITATLALAFAARKRRGLRPAAFFCGRDSARYDSRVTDSS